MLAEEESAITQKASQIQFYQFIAVLAIDIIGIILFYGLLVSPTRLMDPS